MVIEETYPLQAFTYTCRWMRLMWNWCTPSTQANSQWRNTDTLVLVSKPLSTFVSQPLCVCVCVCV